MDESNATLRLSKGDNPIQTSGEDLLERSLLAAELASEFRRIDASDGYVLSLMGPWGSGKTSLVNLVREQLKDEATIPVVDFNPWMFSGVDALVTSFLNELAAQLRATDQRRFATVVERLDRYSDVLTPLVWVPVVGPWAARFQTLTGAAKKFKDKTRKSVREQKDDVAAALAQLDSPIVVVIDDIDRLNTSDIRDMFKLVRLTAHFPNVIYLLVFDRTRVESALGEDGLDGRSYLEKIVQSGIDLPAVPDVVLNRHLATALQEVVDDAGGVERFDQARWPDTLMEVVAPLVTTMRDVRRYAGSTRVSISAVKERVELGDLFALEAVRVFAPDIFAALVRTSRALTTPASAAFGRNTTEESLFEAQIDALVNVDPDRATVVRALVRRLFPAADRHLGGSTFDASWSDTWLRARQVAHPQVLNVYLQRYVSPEMRAFDQAEVAADLIGDAAQFDAHLRSVPTDELEDVIASLRAFSPTFTASDVVPGVSVLVNLMGHIPDRVRGMFDVDARIVVASIIYQLFNKLNGPDDVKDAVDNIVDNCGDLSAKLTVISMTGHVKNVGHGLVDPHQAEVLERALVDEVYNASVEQLANDWDLYRLLYATANWFSYKRPRTIKVDAPAELHHALFSSARNEVRSMSDDARAVTRTPTLPWDTLVTLYKSEANIKTVASELTHRPDLEDVDDIVELITKYLNGWRPPTF